MCGVICRQSSEHIVLSGSPAAAGLDDTEWKKGLDFWRNVGSQHRGTNVALLLPYTEIRGDTKKNEYELNRKTNVWNLMASNTVSNNETPGFSS